MSVEAVARFTVRGQYGPGVIDGNAYRVIGKSGSESGSITETYAAVKFHMRTGVG